MHCLTSHFKSLRKKSQNSPVSRKTIFSKSISISESEFKFYDSPFSILNDEDKSNDILPSLKERIKSENNKYDFELVPSDSFLESGKSLRKSWSFSSSTKQRNKADAILGRFMFFIKSVRDILTKTRRSTLGIVDRLNIKGV